MAAPDAGARRNRMRDERERTENYRRAKERSREDRWNAPGRARVVHPKYGTVVVPHQSNLTAILNAAEYWRCDWLEIRDAEVWAATPEDGPVVKPREFCGLTYKEKYNV